MPDAQLPLLNSPQFTQMKRLTLKKPIISSEAAFEIWSLLDVVANAEDASDTGVEQGGERLSGDHRGSGDYTGVIGINHAVDVGPPAAVKDNEEFGPVRTVQMNADRVGDVDLGARVFEKS